MKSCIIKIRFNDNIPGCSSMVNLCDKLSAADIYSQYGLHNNQLFQHKGLLVTDAFPYKRNELFVPKPAIITDGLKNIGIVSQKALRTIHYIELNQICNFLSGSYDYLQASKKAFGSFYRHDDIVFRMENDSGIYFFALFEDYDVINDFSSFVKKHIMLCINIEVNTEVLYSDSKLFSTLSCQNTRKRIIMSTISTNISESLLRNICDGAYYNIVERKKGPDLDKLCYIQAGAVVSQKAINSYNDICGGCISVGCLEG